MTANKGFIALAAALSLIVVLLIGFVTISKASSNKAGDDWKTRICTSASSNSCYSSVDVYVKEFSPKKGVTCFAANANGSSRYGGNVGISCIKD